VVAMNSRKLDHIAIAAAYVVGCDVFWRMCEAKFFYEGPKYVAALVLGIGYVRFARTTRRALLPVAYLVLLAPSILLTVQALGISGSRESLSFALGGPLCLGIAALFFLQLRAGWDELRTVLLALLTPILSIASIATFTTVTSTDIQFGTQSIHDT